MSQIESSKSIKQKSPTLSSRAQKPKRSQRNNRSRTTRRQFSANK
ncbi:hypothetical protein X975_23917, partial [Stegodyphus mimosarum]